MLLLEIEERESKNLELISQSVKYNQSRQSQNSRRNVYGETDQELDLSGNTGIIRK